MSQKTICIDPILEQLRNREENHEDLPPLTVGDFIRMLEEAEEIVRCKNCKHKYFYDNGNTAEREWVCGRWLRDIPDLNGFCHKGEKGGGA